MISLDPIDKRILAQLQHDGRLSNADLAEKVGLSSSPCWLRVKALEEAGVIKGYAAVLDAKTVGLSVNVFMSVSLSTQNEKSLKEFEHRAAARPEVMECYLMTGDSDYLLRSVVPDLEAYERFVMDFTKIPGLAYTKHAEVSLEEMEASNIVLTDVPTSTIVWGERMTSVGHNLSREILRLRPDIGATIHVHDDATIALLGSGAPHEFKVLSLDPPFVLGKPVHFVPAHVDVEADV